MGGFDHLMVKVGERFGRRIEKWNDSATVDVSGLYLFDREILIPASFCEEIDDASLPSHVHHVMLPNEGY